MSGLARMQRTEAQRLLLALLRADAWHANQFAEPVWREALRLANAHGIAPLLHEQALSRALRDLPAFARTELRAARIAELLREEKRARTQTQALRILAGENGEPPIPTLLLKGAASARTLYSAPELRPRSDLDLLVSPADRNEALRRLFARGFIQEAMTVGTREDEPGWHEKTLLDPGTGEQLDLHFAPSQAPRHRLDARRLFAASVREPALGAAARLLGPEEAALVCVHSLVVHELAVPLISTCDLARLLAKTDLAKLALLAKEVRLARGLWLGVRLLLSLGPDRREGNGQFSLGGMLVDPERLETMVARLSLSRGIQALLRAAARGYDLERRKTTRLRQLWRKALFIDRSRDAARFAAGHALQTMRRQISKPT